MTTRISSRDWEDLSAYLDGELTPRERSRLESRIEARAELRAALEELRKTRMVLRSQPRVRAPRNFTLTPQMVGMQMERRPSMGLFPVMRLTAVLASLLFLIIMLGDFLWLSQSMAMPVSMQESAPLMAREVGETLEEGVAEAPVEKTIPEEELEMPMALESEESLDVASEPAERAAPAPEMPAEDTELYILPTGEALAGTPPPPLASAEPTQIPPIMESIQPEEEVNAMEDSPESRLNSLRSFLFRSQLLRLIEMILLIVGMTTGFVAFLLRPKRTL